ncbi:class I SAM-dependent methyltransferase [Elusimicrobiota bacterium]
MNKYFNYNKSYFFKKSIIKIITYFFENICRIINKSLARKQTLVRLYLGREKIHGINKEILKKVKNLERSIDWLISLIEQFKNCYYPIVPGILNKCEINRLIYEEYKDTDLFAVKQNFFAGFNSGEKKMIEKYMNDAGKILILAGGNGREGVWFAEKNMEVICIDYVEKNIESGIKLANENKLNIKFILGDVQKPDDLLTDIGALAGFKYILFSTYTLIPTRKKRLEILNKLHKYLASDGKLLISFPCYEEFLHPSKYKITFFVFEFLNNFFKCINKDFEKGDIFNGAIYKHLYKDRDAIRREISLADFKIIDSHLGKYILAPMEVTAGES